MLLPLQYCPLGSDGPQHGPAEEEWTGGVVRSIRDFPRQTPPNRGGMPPWRGSALLLAALFCNLHLLLSYNLLPQPQWNPISRDSTLLDRTTNMVLFLYLRTQFGRKVLWLYPFKAPIAPATTVARSSHMNPSAERSRPLPLLSSPSSPTNL